MTNKQELFSKLNRETARIAWRELQRFHANGAVLCLAAAEDLVGAAVALAEDDVAQIGAWLESGALAKVSDERASQWFAEDVELWAVVVAPWVLVQSPAEGPDDE